MIEDVRSGRRILVVDDDAATRKAMQTGLRQDGFLVSVAASAEDALPMILEQPFDAVVADVVMGGMTGIALVRRVRDLRPGLPVVVITGYGSIDAAVGAMREGAADYLPKPVRFEQLVRILDRVSGTRRLGSTDSDPGPSGLVGMSHAMRDVLRRIAAAAPTNATVLIRGESGTGKELAAREIHRASPRRDKPLITVNCAAITETLAESELFGHERGAFTGAVRQRAGRIEQAQGGTLFLDEVGDLSPILQTKLLRVIQDRMVERVGGGKAFEVDVRLVAATNRNLEEMIRNGRFREDLYYRLRVVTIDIPPLRHRIEDLPALVSHLLEILATRHGLVEAPEIGRGVLDAFRSHPWPGNVRELLNVLEELVIIGSGDRITVRDLPRYVRESKKLQDPEKHVLDGTRSMDFIESEAIRRTLQASGGNKAEAARVLGIGLKTLYRKLSGDGTPGPSATDEGSD